MNNLKELTWEHHKEAERQEFVKVMMSGKMNPKLYATYLWNQHKRYDVLEAVASVHNIFSGLPSDIRRKLAIEADFVELWNENEIPTITKSCDGYLGHIKGIMHDPDAIMAHIYVLHMGDLSGGQIINKRVPGSGKMYQFQGDIQQIKEAIRSKCNDSMAEEAKVCFDYSTKLFKDLMELDIEPYLEQAD